MTPRLIMKYLYNNSYLQWGDKERNQWFLGQGRFPPAHSLLVNKLSPNSINCLRHVKNII